MRCTVDDLPEVQILSDIGFLTGRDYGDGTDPDLHNRTFMFRPTSNPYEAGDAWTTDHETPNLCFYPTGLEVAWDEEVFDLNFQEVRMSRPVSVPDLRGIMRICIQSLIDDLAGGDLQ